jgi:hypothetical protein
MAREVAYVAMTRGREANHAFIATDLPDPDYDGAPTPARTGRQVLEQILATQGAELSATETIRRLHHETESLANARRDPRDPGASGDERELSKKSSPPHYRLRPLTQCSLPPPTAHSSPPYAAPNPTVLARAMPMHGMPMAPSEHALPPPRRPSWTT